MIGKLVLTSWYVVTLFDFCAVTVIRYVMLLTNLIQSPELNSSNPSSVVNDVEHRILRCYFRDLCRIYFSN